MVNHAFVSDNQIKDILIYIKGLKHSKQIRMMFFCSLNGMRSINFAYLQVKDVYTNEGKVKDVIELDQHKNKGNFKAQYYVNKQFKKEFQVYYEYMQSKYGEKLTPCSYLFTSQKQNKPFNRVSISRIFHNIYKKFDIHGASHLGRHIYITKLINSGTNPFLVKTLVNHKNIQTTQRYYNNNPQQLWNASASIRY